MGQVRGAIIVDWRYTVPLSGRQGDLFSLGRKSTPWMRPPRTLSRAPRNVWERELLPEDVVYGEADIGEGVGSEELPASVPLNLLVPFGGGLSVYFDRVRRKVHHPNLLDSRAGIQRKFDHPIILAGGIRHFDEEENVLRARMRLPIIVSARSNHRQVRLRLRVG